MSKFYEFYSVFLSKGVDGGFSCFENLQKSVNPRPKWMTGGSLVLKIVLYYHTNMVWDFDYSSVNSIKALLKDNGLFMSRKFGQNFLINKSALDKIVGLAGVIEGRRVWEVGPGIGALSTALVHAGANLTAFEIDRGFCRILKEKVFTGEEAFTLIEGDVLKNWPSEYEKNGVPNLVCANLPYNIGSVFIARLIEERVLPERMVFTLQKEVVRRMCSAPNSELYGSFSILTSIDYVNKDALTLKSSSFWPAPDVDSAVVLMEKREEPLVPQEEVRYFISFMHKLFSARRKTILNNLKNAGFDAEIVENAIKTVGLKLSARAEELEIPEILRLMRTIRD